MRLYLENGEEFASGATNYEYRPATERERTPRITVSIILDNFHTLAFVDTGGVYGICSPEIAASLNLDPKDAIPADPLLWGRGRLEGSLYRIPVTLIAEEGESLQFEPTFFIPQVDQAWEDDLSCVLGMYSCLERIRFAVDPSTDTFYFGELK